jgi:hypothetical protein
VDFTFIIPDATHVLCKEICTWQKCNVFIFVGKNKKEAPILRAETYFSKCLVYITTCLNDVSSNLSTCIIISVDVKFFLTFPPNLEFIYITLSHRLVDLKK